MYISDNYTSIFQPTENVEMSLKGITITIFVNSICIYCFLLQLCVNISCRQLQFKHLNIAQAEQYSD